MAASLTYSSGSAPGGKCAKYWLESVGKAGNTVLHLRSSLDTNHLDKQHRNLLFKLDVWVSRFKHRIKFAPARFELGVTPCELDQFWDSNKSHLSIYLILFFSEQV